MPATDSQPTVDVKRRGVLAAMFGSAVGIGFTLLGTASALWAAMTSRFLMANVTAEAQSVQSRSSGRLLGRPRGDQV